MLVKCAEDHQCKWTPQKCFKVCIQESLAKMMMWYPMVASAVGGHPAATRRDQKILLRTYQNKVDF
jgi:hypothetical protein